MSATAARRAVSSRLWPKRLFAVAAAFVAASTLAACNAERLARAIETTRLNDPRRQPVATTPSQVPFNVGGYWCFSEDGYPAMNQIRVSRGGVDLLIDPVERNGGASTGFHRIAPNAGMLFRKSDGPGAYEFFSPNEAIWRSNDRSNREYLMRRCG